MFDQRRCFQRGMDIESSRMKRFDRSQTLRRKEKETRKEKDKLKRSQMTGKKGSEGKEYNMLDWEKRLKSSVERKNYDNFKTMIATIETEMDTNEERDSIINEIWKESSIINFIGLMVQHESQSQSRSLDADAHTSMSCVLCFFHTLITCDKEISNRNLSTIIDILSMYQNWIDSSNMSIMILNIYELAHVCKYDTKGKLIGMISQCTKLLLELIRHGNGNTRDTSFEVEIHSLLQIIFGFTIEDKNDTKIIMAAGGMNMIIASIVYFGANCNTMSKIMAILRNTVIDCQDDLSIIMKHNIICRYIWQCFRKGSYFVQMDAAYTIKYLLNHVNFKGFEIISNELENCARSITARHELARILLDITQQLTSQDNHKTPLQKWLQQTNLESTIEQLALDENIDKSMQNLANDILNKWSQINK